jgi:hypothetical protein
MHTSSRQEGWMCIGCGSLQNQKNQHLLPMSSSPQIQTSDTRLARSIVVAQSGISTACKNRPNQLMWSKVQSTLVGGLTANSSCQMGAHINYIMQGTLKVLTMQSQSTEPDRKYKYRNGQENFPI